MKIKPQNITLTRKQSRHKHDALEWMTAQELANKIGISWKLAETTAKGLAN